MLAVQLVMPSRGDMDLLDQSNGTITLKPMFFGGDCSGPHIRIVDVEKKDGKISENKTIANYRIKIRSDGKLELKKGQSAEELSE